MSEFNTSNLRKEHGNEGPDLVGTTELTSPYFMVPPSGTTAERPHNPPAGTLRFNTDIGSLEYFRGDTIGWESIDRVSPNLGGGTGSNAGTGARGVMAGGNTPTNLTDIDYITISTLGNSQDFGNLATASTGRAGCASRVRGIFACGASPGGYLNDIDMITFSSTGSREDFGNADTARGYRGALSNNIRGCIAGGEDPKVDSIEYITIATTGNGTDFGNLGSTVAKPFGAASTTRGIFGGGNGFGVTMEYIEIMSTGNAVDFGDMLTSNITMTACCSATRAVLGSIRNPAYSNQMEYFTMATTGNSTDFGDQTDNRGAAAPMSSSIRGVWAGGYGSPAFRTTIDYVEIATTGDAKEFGDVGYAADHLAGCSNGHGGL